MAASTRRRQKIVEPAEIRFSAADIVMRHVHELKPFPNNPKIHTPEQIAAIAANMVAFGFDQPILIDEDDVILKGHGRSEAAPIAGFDLVPTILRTGLSFEQKWAIVISDNALPAMTGFDHRLLRIGLTHLAKADYPLQLTGFDNVHLATFIGGNAGASPPNDVPDLAPAISKPGETWLMGKHRLVCGDSSNEKTVAKLLGDANPRLMATDPPYNFLLAGSGGLHRKPSTTHAHRAEAEGINKFEVDRLCELRETNIIFTSKVLLADYLDLARARKLTWDVAVLHRTAALPANNRHLIPDIDYIVMMGNLVPERGLETAEYSKYFSAGHWDRPVPWAKPVELMSRILRLYSKVGDETFEPYCGSGTTIIAAEMTGRACYAVEIDPTYVDLSVRRWQKFAGKPAILQGTKKTFDQIAKDRIKPAR
jgi:DNA modification methylase